MREAATAEARPYHHGDLRRALVDAARRILEAEGVGALSLRAVAREAKVSPAAPYHHFKDKGELLDAIAHEGWEDLDSAMANVRASARSPSEKMTAIGAAYVHFARENPALYRVMYDVARDKDSLPDHVQKNDDSAYCQVRQTIQERNDDASVSEIDLELATIAAWCAAHGLAEMLSFKQFEPLKEQLGGEENFLRAVLQHLGMFSKVHAP